MSRDLPPDADAEDTGKHAGDIAYKAATGVARIARAGAYVTGGALIASEGEQGPTTGSSADDSQVAGWAVQTAQDPQPNAPSPVVTYPDPAPNSVGPDLAHQAPNQQIPDFWVHVEINPGAGADGHMPDLSQIPGMNEVPNTDMGTVPGAPGSGGHTGIGILPGPPVAPGDGIPGIPHLGNPLPNLGNGVPGLGNGVPGLPSLPSPPQIHIPGLNFGGNFSVPGLHPAAAPIAENAAPGEVADVRTVADDAASTGPVHQAADVAAVGTDPGAGTLGGDLSGFAQSVTGALDGLDAALVGSPLGSELSGFVQSVLTALDGGSDAGPADSNPADAGQGGYGPIDLGDQSGLYDGGTEFGQYSDAVWSGWQQVDAHIGPDWASYGSVAQVQFGVGDIGQQLDSYTNGLGAPQFVDGTQQTGPGAPHFGWDAPQFAPGVPHFLGGAPQSVNGVPHFAGNAHVEAESASDANGPGASEDAPESSAVPGASSAVIPGAAPAVVPGGAPVPAAAQAVSAAVPVQATVAMLPPPAPVAAPPVVVPQPVAPAAEAMQPVVTTPLQTSTHLVAATHPIGGALPDHGGPSTAAVGPAAFLGFNGPSSDFGLPTHQHPRPDTGTVVPSQVPQVSVAPSEDAATQSYSPDRTHTPYGPTIGAHHPTATMPDQTGADGPTAVDSTPTRRPGADDNGSTTHTHPGAGGVDSTTAAHPGSSDSSSTLPSTGADTSAAHPSSSDSSHSHGGGDSSSAHPSASDSANPNSGGDSSHADPTTAAHPGGHGPDSTSSAHPSSIDSGTRPGASDGSGTTNTPPTRDSGPSQDSSPSRDSHRWTSPNDSSPGRDGPNHDGPNYNGPNPTPPRDMPVPHHEPSMPGRGGMTNPGDSGSVPDAHIAPHMPMQPPVTMMPQYPMRPAAHLMDSNETSPWTGHDGLHTGLFSAGAALTATPALAHIPDHSVLDLHTAL